jgi:hypothetical protein
MKNILILSFLLTGLAMCNNPAKQVTGSGKPTIAIYYFHATNRCGNCMAIEENTKKALDLYFPGELKAGAIKFTSVNVDETANKSLIDKCEASPMMLCFVKTNAAGETTKTDFSEFAINTARSKPDAYMQGIRDRVVEQLK